MSAAGLQVEREKKNRVKDGSRVLVPHTMDLPFTKMGDEKEE